MEAEVPAEKKVLKGTSSKGVLTEEHLACRVYGHQWESVSIDFKRDYFVDHLECQRCCSFRHDYVSRRTHAIEIREYTYAEGYELEGYQRRTRDSFRGELFRLRTK